LSDTVYN